jgi:hypothetical protein
MKDVQQKRGTVEKVHRRLANLDVFGAPERTQTVPGRTVHTVRKSGSQSGSRGHGETDDFDSDD